MVLISPDGFHVLNSKCVHSVDATFQITGAPSDVGNHSIVRKEHFGVATELNCSSEHLLLRAIPNQDCLHEPLALLISAWNVDPPDLLYHTSTGFVQLPPELDSSAGPGCGNPKYPDLVFHSR